MTHAPVVWFVVPLRLDDPERVTGGNVYDQRVRDGLAGRGRAVRTVEVDPDAAPGALAQVPAGALALVDGLVAIGAPGEVEALAARARVVLLVHMLAASFPDAEPGRLDAERRALRCAHRVIATSAWLGDELVARGLVDSAVVSVVRPGADDAPLATGSPEGTALLCVGAVAPHKGHDTLVEALAALDRGSAWRCTIAGSTAVDPGFASRVIARAAAQGMSGRVTWAGVLDRRALDGAYDRADLLVAPSRAESYGLAVADALRRGIPVLASRVGGIPEAVGADDAAIFVPPGDPVALAGALRRWIADPALRARLSEGARCAAGARAPWSVTADAVDDVLRSAP